MSSASLRLEQIGAINIAVSFLGKQQINRLDCVKALRMYVSMIPSDINLFSRINYQRLNDKNEKSHFPSYIFLSHSLRSIKWTATLIEWHRKRPHVIHKQKRIQMKNINIVLLLRTRPCWVWRTISPETCTKFSQIDIFFQSRKASSLVITCIRPD